MHSENVLSTSKCTKLRLGAELRQDLLGAYSLPSDP